MLHVIMLRLVCLCNVVFLFNGVFAETTWEIPERKIEILLDGFLEEWMDVPSKILVPDGSGLQSGGEFGEDDLHLKIRALWDEEYLYLALDWHDDVWDIQKVTRREAVWIDPDGTRRDRMHFFDNFKFHIRKSDYDYTMWVSPRSGDDGPYFWCRLLEGYGGMERATGAPMITARNHGDRVTIEVELLWKQLKIKPKKNRTIPLRLVVADADLPGTLLESKLEYLKWVGWKGKLKFVEADR
jgi:hypothetical protein